MKLKYIENLVLGIALFTGFLLFAGGHVEWPTASHAQQVYLENKTAAPKTDPAVADVKSLSQAFTSLTETVSPTVVNIYTKSGTKNARQQRELPPELEDQMQQYFGFGGRPFAVPQMEREALGSGFVINANEGYIVTNAHVVRMAGQNADEIMVKFIGEEDNSKGHLAKIVGADDISDVALLKLVEKKKDLKAVALGDSSKAKTGEWVLAIGNPYGHTNTVTQGIISAIGRSLEGLRSDFLQTSAGINPGNSGGPLINMNGEVIGINSAMDPRAQNIGFAIPINVAKDVIDQLVDGGHVKRAWLGIGIDEVSEEAAAYMKLKEKEGVLVKQVVADAPAAKAGIETYDVIRKVNGQPIRNVRDLYKSLEKLSAGKTAEIELLRAGINQVVKVKLTEQPLTPS